MLSAVEAVVARFAAASARRGEAAVTGGGGRRCAAAAAAGAAPGTGTVINAAAYTDVEGAEDHEERAYAVNDRAAANLAASAAAHGLGLVHVSTDFVFDGTKDGPYTEDDEPHPLNAYGRSKLAGERSVAAAHPLPLVVRTAWVYGPSVQAGTNFPTKILALARTRDELQVVDDEMGTPTAAVDLARGILGLLGLGATGLFHLAGSGVCSRFEMAREILAAADLRTRLVPVERGRFPSKVVRPANSALSSEKAATLGVVMPPWQTSLRAYVQDQLMSNTSRRRPE